MSEKERRDSNLSPVLQLLGVLYLGRGTGDEMATAVMGSIKSCNLEVLIRAMCFNTTVSNTGHTNGTSASYRTLRPCPTLDTQMVHVPPTGQYDRIQHWTHKWCTCLLQDNTTVSNTGHTNGTGASYRTIRPYPTLDTQMVHVPPTGQYDRIQHWTHKWCTCLLQDNTTVSNTGHTNGARASYRTIRPYPTLDTQMVHVPPTGQYDRIQHWTHKWCTCLLQDNTTVSNTGHTNGARASYRTIRPYPTLDTQMVHVPPTGQYDRIQHWTHKWCTCLLQDNTGKKRLSRGC